MPHPRLYGRHRSVKSCRGRYEARVSGAAPPPPGAGPAAGTIAARRDRGRDAGRRLRRLRDADLVVVSFRKSGRTWLRAMLSHLCHRRYGVPEGELLEFDNLHRLDPRIPRVFFTHDLPWDPWNRWGGRLLRPEPFRGKRVLLLVRDPRDATVSLHFQLAKREPPEQRRRERLPAGGVPPWPSSSSTPATGSSPAASPSSTAGRPGPGRCPASSCCATRTCTPTPPAACAGPRACSPTSRRRRAVPPSRSPRSTACARRRRAASSAAASSGRAIRGTRTASRCAAAGWAGGATP